MADALLGVVFEKLSSLAQNELATISGINGKVEKLLGNLEVIRAVVEDAEQKQITDESIKRWLEQLKDAVYVLDDILDECSIESHGLSGLCSLIKNPKNIMFRRKIGNRLKEITIKFDDIAERKKKFMLESYRGRRDEVADHEERETSATSHEPRPYGRQDDKEKIVEFLLSQERNSDSLSVYPIVGLGGMGKTTLSRMAYNDTRVSDTFSPEIWICVSEDFSVKRILCSVVEIITEKKCDGALPLAVMENKVKELLQSKKYLLVLDDVWIQNQQMKFGLNHEKWNHLKAVLSCGSKGASVLISTRDMDVAQIMGTCQAHCLQGLSEDDCWFLFKQHAFGANNEERAELVAIGKEIVKKCGGSPLAARALGGLLSLKIDEREWLEVKDSSLWNLHDENCILSALRLSYFHLTPTLRQCFAFCAMFPKDTEIIKEELIYLWMANGFIPSKENMEVEDVGDQIWKELCRKLFFQDISIDYQGKTTFKMHDLVHDLAESVTGKECVILGDANMTNLLANTHHVLYNRSGKLSFKKGTFKNVESLRTLYQFKASYTKYACPPTHHALRVLQTSSSNLSSLGSLIHLRYLELCDIEIKTLPDSIYSLQKLEILKLRWLKKLTCLPKHLTRLQNLRHLVIEGCHSLSCMFPNIRALSCLRTLSKYIVSSKVGHSLAELRDLELSGDLDIKGLENAGSLSEAQDANLKAKRDLHKLSLSWSNEGGNSRSNATNLDLVVLEALQPHSNLKKLIINGYEGIKSPSWIGMLSSLVDLQLQYCHNCVQLSSLGKLPSLRRLILEVMNNMKYIDEDESYDGVEVRAFPSLEELILYKLPKLERLLKEGKGEMFACLSKLVIHKCPELVLPSCIPSLRTLGLANCRNDLASFPVGQSNCLRTLSIYNFERMKELPEEFFKNLNALEYLEISCCYELECLPEQICKGLLSLRTLILINCKRLRSLLDGIEHLTALEELEISGGCNELECLPEQGWERLRSLRALKLFHCERLRSLPNGIEHLNTLEELDIRSWHELECLPEQGWEGLLSLRTLSLRHCPSLRSLPDGVRHLTSLQSLIIDECKGLRSLPDGVRHLTSLQSLWIMYCPVLAERCKEGTGEDWDKIAHVPKLNIIPRLRFGQRWVDLLLQFGRFYGVK